MIEKLDTAVAFIGKLVGISSFVIVVFVMVLAVVGVLLWFKEYKGRNK